MEWGRLLDEVYKAELKEGPFGRHISTVFHPSPEEELIAGHFSNFLSRTGKAALQYSDGEIVKF